MSTENDDLETATRRIDEEEESGSDLPEIDPTNYTVEQLEEEIWGVEDSEWLEEVMEKEKEGDNRAGAKTTIQEQFTMAVEKENREEGDGEMGRDEISLDPANYTVGELEEEIQAMDDVEKLDRLEGMESNRDDRVGVQDAIDERRQELTGSVDSEEAEESAEEEETEGVSDDEEEDEEVETDDGDGDTDEEEQEENPYPRAPTEEEEGIQILKKMCVANLLADEMGCEKEILYGGDEGIVGWNDDYITLTKEKIGPGQFVSWAYRVYRQIALGMADGDAEEFQTILFQNEDMVSEFVDENWERSIGTALEEAGYSPDNYF